MKQVLSASTALSTPTLGASVASIMPHYGVALPRALDPVYQCPAHTLDTESVCPDDSCGNKFPIRYGVCFTSWWRTENSYEYGMGTFCSLTCLLRSAVMLGADVTNREFRDETQTLH
jgi:hypothetical protein